MVLALHKYITEPLHKQNILENYEGFVVSCSLNTLFWDEEQLKLINNLIFLMTELRQS